MTKIRMYVHFFIFCHQYSVDFKVRVFSKKATKFDEIFTVLLTTYCQIDGEDFVNFCGLLRKRELYICSRNYTVD